MTKVLENLKNDALLTPLGTDAEVVQTGGAQTVLAAPESAEEQELEGELGQLKSDSEALERQGIISSSDARAQVAEVERTRTYFRDLPREERTRILRERRDFARRLLTRQLTGASVVNAHVRLNHTRMSPLFELSWPYINRMSVNLQRFGAATFGRGSTGAVEEWFESYLVKIEEYVDEQLRVARAYRERREAEMVAARETVFRPTITLPALERDVEAYTRYSMRVMSAMIKFDQAMDEFDFMVWNGIRDQSDVDAEIVRFLKLFNPLTVRGYVTHTKLMRTIHDFQT
jgi:hypothetical protein